MEKRIFLIADRRVWRFGILVIQPMFLVRKSY